MTTAGIRQLLISEPGSVMRRDRPAARVAVVIGLIFFFAGLVKFVFHSWELNAFRSFGLPWPSALEILAGALETVGGVLLVLRLLVAPVALLLAATMAVAIGASGIGHGDVIPSLTLAPALLLATVFLLVRTLRHDSARPAMLRAMQRVHVVQDFPQPVEAVFSYFNEQENLEPLFGAKVKRLSDGSDGTRNGVGASRELRVGPLPGFVETNTEVIPNELVRYRITKGGILKNHEGVMRFSRQGEGSRLDYTIEFDGKAPGVGALVKTMLTRSITAALRRFADRGTASAH